MDPAPAGAVCYCSPTEEGAVVGAVFCQQLGTWAKGLRTGRCAGEGALPYALYVSPLSVPDPPACLVLPWWIHGVSCHGLLLAAGSACFLDLLLTVCFPPFLMSSLRVLPHQSWEALALPIFVLQEPSGLF